MTQLAITTTYERASAIDLKAAAQQLAFEQQLQQYVSATHGWTLGTVLARMLLAIRTVITGKRDVGTVLFGRTA